MSLFGTAGIRGAIGEDLDLGFSMRLGASISRYFSSIGQRAIICACDGRTSSESLKQSLISSILYHGLDVEDIGVVPTPVLAFSTAMSKCPGIMVTASHNPPSDNGFKVFFNGFEIGLKEEKTIEGHFFNKDPFSFDWRACGTLHGRDVVADYVSRSISFLFKMFESRSLDGMRILVDSGNGVGAEVIQKMFNSLDADVHILNDHLSGLFPARPSEPTMDNLRGVVEYAEEYGPDIIIAQDGDADRVNIIGPSMELIPEDDLIALFANLYTKEGDKVVLSIDTSLRTDQLLESKGVSVLRVPLGYLHDGIKKYSPSFAAEPWKHIHMPFGTWIDGIMSSMVLTFMANERPLGDLFKNIPRYHQIKENMPLDGIDVNEFIGRTKDQFSSRGDVLEILTTSGIRINFSDRSWILVRPSGTEPKLRIIVEAPEKERLYELSALIKNVKETTL
ncbi:MAG TPA: phosphoglucosamine mutase [Candidatus Methanofastidiosa archaeon]|nr:phosphoglucosamine mutase [Candidatus Methanofastidiosa archaeon]HPR41621.1 phosphoglucosamine mutase [Candidatus Methanofastidiosa archaeon]